MTYFRRSTPVLLVLLTLSPHPARATEPFAQVHTSLVSFLTEQRGVRSLALGSTGAASLYAVSSGHVNPATVAWADATVLSTSRQQYASPGDSDIGIAYIDARLLSGWSFTDESTGDGWRLGGLLGYTNEDLEPQIVRTIYLPEGTGETFDPDDSIYTALAAGSWTKSNFTIGAGLAAKYVDFSLLESGWAFDWGMLAAFSFHPGEALIRPRVGVCASNLDDGFGDAQREHDLAGESSFGLGLDVESRRVAFGGRVVPVVLASIDCDNIMPADEDGHWAIGWEVSFFDLAQVRIGLEEDWIEVDTWGLGLGWEFGRWLLRADYAHERWIAPLLGEMGTNTFGCAAGLRL
jgi:hypothetical protein